MQQLEIVATSVACFCAAKLPYQMRRYSSYTFFEFLAYLLLPVEKVPEFQKVVHTKR